MLDRFTDAVLGYSFDSLQLDELSGRRKGNGPLMLDPMGLALDSVNGLIYVVDNDLNAVFSIQPNGDRAAAWFRLRSSGAPSSSGGATDVAEATDSSRLTPSSAHRNRAVPGLGLRGCASSTR